MTENDKIRVIAEKIMGWPAFDLATPGYGECEIVPKLIMNINREWVSHSRDNECRVWNPFLSWSDAGEVLEALQRRQDEEVADTGPKAIAEAAWKFAEGL